MPSLQPPPLKLVQMLQPSPRKRPPVHPGLFSSRISAHEGPQETGALAAARVVQVEGCPGAAHRALPENNVVAAPPQANLAARWKQGRGAGPSDAAPAGATKLPGSPSHCPQAESCEHPAGPAVSPARRSLLSRDCAMCSSLCARRCALATTASATLLQKANGKGTCCREWPSRLQPLAATWLQLMPPELFYDTIRVPSRIKQMGGPEAIF